MTCPASCPTCSAPLPEPGAECARCLLASALGDPNPTRVGPGFLDDLLLPGDELVIAGRYRVLEVLGRGAMGVVYRARQDNLGRIVAVKMLTAGVFADETARTRFLAEAKAAARLRHPNLVTIHDWGEDRGQPFFSMELVEGPSLAHLLRDGPLDPGRAARLARIVAEAIHHAHESGIVHRDLKPANLLIDTDGQPRITDFGIAKELGDAGELTATHGVLGSPGYLAPEQASTEHGPVGPATDVYALGSVLYHLLTGRPPFQAGSPIETIQQMLRNDPVSLRALNAAVPRDLETITLRCLEKAPAHRFSSARALAEDLGRWERGEPILARPVGRLEKVGKWIAHHRAVTALSAALALALLVGFVLVLGQWRRATTANLDLRASLDTLQMQRAERHSENGDRSSALTDLAAILRRSTGNRPAAARALSVLLHAGWKEPVGAALRHEGYVLRARFDPEGNRLVTAAADGAARLWDARTGAPLGEPMRHSNAVWSVAFSPDGRRVATGALDGTARLWDATTGRPASPPLTHHDTVADLAFGSDGTRLATASEDEVRLWDPRGPVPTPVGPPLVHSNRVRSVAFSPEGARLLTLTGEIGDETDRAGVAQLWDAVDGRPLGQPMLHDDRVFSAAFHPRGTFVVTASADGTVRRWDGRTGAPVGEPLRLHEAVRSAEYSPDGTRLLTVSGDRVARVWEADTGRPLSAPIPIRGESAVTGGDVMEALGSFEAAFSPNGLRLLTRSITDGVVRLWDASSGRPLDEPMVHAGWVAAAGFSPRGDRVVTTTTHGLAQLWEVRPDALPGTPLRHPDSVRSARFDPTGRRVLTACEDGIARLWDTDGIPAVRLQVSHGDALLDARFGEDGRILWTISKRSVAGWDATTGEARKPTLALSQDLRFVRLAPRDSRILTVAEESSTAELWEWGREATNAVFFRHAETMNDAGFHPDGRRVATASDDHSAIQWDVDSGRPLGPPLLHRDAVLAVRYRPDGARLATASADGTARMWDTAGGQPVGPVLQHTRAVVFVDFSPDSRRMVTASLDGTARVWDAATGEAVGDPLRHASEVYAAVFSADAARVATVARDGTARVWDARTGRALSEPLRHPGPITQVGFAPDGERLLIPTQGESAWLWDVPWPQAPAPPWFADFLDSLAASSPGGRASDDATPRGSRTAGAAGVPADPGGRDPFLRAARWFVAPREQRPLGPGSPESAKAHVARCLELDTVEALLAAIHLDPTDALAHARLAEWVAKENPVRADFLLHHALRLAPDSLEVWLSRLRVLSDYPVTPEILEIAREATTRFPETAVLWLARGTMEAQREQWREADDALSRGLSLLPPATPGDQTRVLALLDRSRVRRHLGRPYEAGLDFCAARGIPPRPPEAPPELLDLTSVFNAAPADDWHNPADSGNNLASLPVGLRELDGIRWDLRGVVQLNSTNLARTAPGFPAEVRGIPVGQRCSALQFLQGTGWTDAPGTVAAEYVVHYADGGVVRVPVVYGRDLRNWQFWPSMAEAEKTGGNIAWRGAQPRWEKSFPDWGVRLYRMIWRNPEPGREVATLDFVSGGRGTAPFLVAITAASP